VRQQDERGVAGGMFASGVRSEGSGKKMERNRLMKVQRRTEQIAEMTSSLFYSVSVSLFIFDRCAFFFETGHNFRDVENSGEMCHRHGRKVDPRSNTTSV